jgi:hypothetical protein
MQQGKCGQKRHLRERNLLGRLDSSIRYHKRKQGLRIVKNTYTGFDTEFNNVDIGKIP